MGVSVSELDRWYADDGRAAELTVGIICVCAPEISQACGSCTRSQLQNASILQTSAVSRLRRLKGSNDLEARSGQEDLYGSGVSVLQSEPGLEQQDNGTVHVGNSDASTR